MSHVIAIVDEDAGLGYRLAGVDVRKAATPEEAARQVESALRERELRLVIVDEELFGGLPRALRRTAEESRQPVFVPVPSVPLRKGALGPEEYVARLMRRAVGYQVRIRR